MNLLQLLMVHEPWVYTKGWIVTLVGFCIVIIALYILSLLFTWIANYFIKQDKKKSAPKVEVKKEEAQQQAKVADGEIPAEVLTAIGMALYLSTNLHDEESNVLTIEHHPTAWDSKYYGISHWNR